MSGAVVIKGDSEENIVTGTVNEMTLGEKTDIIVGGFGVCCVGAWVDLSPLKMEAFGIKIEVSGLEAHITGGQFHATGSQTHIIVGNETVTVTGNQQHTIRGKEFHITSGTVLHITDGEAEHFYNNKMTEVCNQDKYETVKGDKYETVTGSVYHFHNGFTKATAAFDLTIYNDAQNPTEQIGSVEGDSHELALAHNLEILATAGPAPAAQTSLKLVPASATLGSAIVNINGGIINLGQPNAPVPILTNLADILAGLAAAQEAAAAAAAAALAAAEAQAAAQAAAETATAALFTLLPG